MKAGTAPVATILIIALGLLAVAGIAFGSVNLGAGTVLRCLFAPSQESAGSVYIVRNLRLPRVISAIAAGAALSLCGLVFQTVFQNPMADSYILGISSGASCAVGLAMVLGLYTAGSATIPIFAFTGSVLTAVVLFTTSHKNPRTLLLTGIAMNFLLSALSTLMVYIGGHQYELVLFWTMGRLSNTDWPQAVMMLTLASAASIFVSSRSRRMDLLLMDDSTAISSGLDVKKERLVLLVAAAALTAIVVAFCGVIGFVGLMSPHFMRIIAGPSHKRLIPLSMLLGSDILLLSDIVARLLGELPVGIITSILGASLFLVLLARRRSSWSV